MASRNDYESSFRVPMLKHHKTRYPNAKHVKQRYDLAKRYFDFLSKRTHVDKKTRKKLVFSTK